ncbi:MAG: tagaturonate reductase [Bacteroidota bacterium]
MILSKENVGNVKKMEWLDIPPTAIFSLPEKVLQFGTGVLLRGLPDYFIDKANKQGIFNGRVVVVKSTGQGDTAVFGKQDNLYTQCVRGIENGKQVEEAIINASISRVLSAATQWPEILACATNPQLQVIISNTTEVGIVLHNNDDVQATPPVSFPGKLLALLLKRYTHFKGSAESGLVIIPTELIIGNGAKLRDIVIELSRQNKLEEAFITWIQTANDFCNSLVDRIVPGKLPEDDRAAMESRLGYNDDLMIMSEVYRLWAIETANEKTRDILSFSKVDKGVVIAPDINRFRELKLRLLNGSHTFTCALAVQMGFDTVKQAMEDECFRRFITTLMMEEIVPAIVSAKVTEAAGLQFSADVLERYKNPFIEHHWLSISLQYSSKMKLRNVPVLLQYYEQKNTVPRCMALGFAAYLLFMKSEKTTENVFTGHAGGKPYIINDDRAATLYSLWHTSNTNNFAQNVLQDTGLWGSNLDTLPAFCKAVAENIEMIKQKGMVQTLQLFQQAGQIL